MNVALRARKGIRVLLALWLVYFVPITFYDNTKEVKYAIHIVAFYDEILGVWIAHSLTKATSQRLVATLPGMAFVVVSVGGIAYTSLLKDDYHKTYLPTAQFLQRTAAPPDRILAGSQFRFALGFERNIVDDHEFTFRTRKNPEFIVLSNGYQGVLLHDKLVHPEIVRYFEDLLQQNYQPVFSQGEYQVLDSKQKLDANARGTSGA